MSWLYYLLEANLYLILFYGFYRMFLHKETFYTLNRYFLLISSFTAFILPFFQLGFLLKSINLSENIIYQEIEQGKPLLTTENTILFFYSIVAIVFISKVIWGFMRVINLLKKPNKIVENGITIVELANTKTAFSFFNMLFIDPELPQKATILRHEMVHINQKHSYDVLFFELLRSFSWFNPITYLLKNDIKLLHEYLADEETTNIEIGKYEYAMFLIQNSCGDVKVQLTNQIFNSSILKRRINMLNQKKSAKWARLRLLLVLPVLAGMLCISTMAFTKDYGVVDLYPKSAKNISAPQDTVKRAKAKEIVIAEPVKQIKKMKGGKYTPPPPPIEAPRSKKLNGLKNGQNPPPPPPAPGQKSKVKGVKLAPPPPPVEPKSPKVQKLDIKIAPPPPPPPVEPAQKKKLGKDDVIYGEIIEGPQ
ncbi:M56 family metallopeptidase [Pedobacter jamesrossensis]|uniref:M56 family metallopeptidase n=1 Tax=Pedobacter jamesrossensis TaxID=1908238 RepID=A0ABV8NGS5_9SPHI